MSRDWHAWYTAYDDPTSSLARRLAEVRRQLVALLAGSGNRPVRLLSMCAGDGRDTLPVLAAHAPHAEALLVELDPQLAARARDTAGRLGLAGVQVRTGDAGLVSSYVGAGPADVLLACGVFGNIPDGDLLRTVDALPGLLAPGGTVVWTRGAKVPQDPSELAGDPSEHVRDVFAGAGFAEVAFVRPDDASYRVGVHRLAVPPAPAPAVERLFAFV